MTAKTEAAKVARKVTEPQFTVTAAKAGAMPFKQAASNIKSRFNGIDKERGKIAYDAALLTYNVEFVANTYGSGAGRSNWRVYSDDLGVSPSYVKLLRTLGRAAVVHGIKPNTKRWAFLVQKANAGEVARLLREDTLDLAALDHLVEHGLAKVEKSAAKDAQASTDLTEPKPEDSTMAALTAGVRTPDGLAQHLEDLTAIVMGKLKPENVSEQTVDRFHLVAETLQEFVAQVHRAHAAKHTAAKTKATPKPRAPKAKAAAKPKVSLKREPVAA